MTTNVKPEDLNYNNYNMEIYDKNIINSIPGYEELHQEIKNIIEKENIDKNIQILELGIGTGLTAIRILNKIKNVKYIAIDFSENMISNAKEKLSPFNVELIKGDFSEIDLPKYNDIVVSIIAIHHQKSDEDKRELFKKIFNSLNENGIFIFGDLVTFKDRHKASLNEAKHYHFLIENIKDEKILNEWAYHHKYLNNLSTIEDQILWLKDVGFSEVYLIYNKFNTALILARK